MNQCQFRAPFAGKLVRCNKVAKWAGKRLGTNTEINVCDGHKHFVRDPERIAP